MGRATLNARERKEIEAAVDFFDQQKHLFETFAQVLTAYLTNHKTLSPYISFIKHRIKDSDHLREKLGRKYIEGKSKADFVPITTDNLFQRITDLAGIRILHLHTEQMRDMHPCILEIVEEQQLRLAEEPVANCWDVEYEQLFRQFGIETKSRDSMYTTVHYLIEANQKTKITCELQVRTLMDEVWGEVSHRVNYPEPSEDAVCIAQLKVLARLTSGCTRLVDSIFKTNQGGDAK